MESEAWIHQLAKQIAKLGAENASWYVSWIDPQHKRRMRSCGPGKEGQKKAKEFKKQIDAELRTDTYKDRSKRKWGEFREKYDSEIVSRLAPRSQVSIKNSLAHFERVACPSIISKISDEMIDKFITARLLERGKKKGSHVSAASVNCDLRNIKAALRTAKRWKYLQEIPEFRFQREPKKIVSYVTPEHFAAIYLACKKAKFPNDLPNVTAETWWQSLLAVGYMTGWRIGEILAMRKEDFSPDEGTAIMRIEDTKGKREELVPLHPIVVEHLRRVMTFDPYLFPWNHDRRTLDVEFHRIQAAARFKDEKGEEQSIYLPCREKHEHTDACHRYGFHDLRRAFATRNESLSVNDLQGLMRHKSYQTTQRYINMTNRLREAVDSIKVPDVFAARVAN